MNDAAQVRQFIPHPIGNNWRTPETGGAPLLQFRSITGAELAQNWRTGAQLYPPMSKVLPDPHALRGR